jgi:hypothetical protein
MHVQETAVIMVTASTEHAIARLVGLARLALRRHALLIAATRVTVLEVLACAILNTPGATARFNNVLTLALEPEPAST